MNFFTTKITLASPSLPNSLANGCFHVVRDVFGGHEVAVLATKEIATTPIQPKNDFFLLTVVKVIFFIIVIPVGSISRFFSLANSDVRLALFHTPKPNSPENPPVTPPPNSPPTPTLPQPQVKLPPPPPTANLPPSNSSQSPQPPQVKNLLPTPQPSTVDSSTPNPPPDVQPISQTPSQLQPNLPDSQQPITGSSFSLPVQTPPPLSPEQKQDNSLATQTPTANVSSSNSKSPDDLAGQMAEVCRNPKTKSQDIQKLLNKGCSPSTQNILAVIANKNFNLLSCFTGNTKIIVNDSKHVIFIIKAALKGNCSELARKLTCEPYSKHIKLNEVDEELLKNAKSAHDLGMCDWIFSKQPSLALAERSGLAYLKLIYSSKDKDPHIKELINQLSMPTSDYPLQRIQCLVDQFYIHIPYDLLCCTFNDSIVNYSSDTPITYFAYYLLCLEKLLFQQTTSVSQISHKNSPKKWNEKENAFLDVFNQINQTKRNEVPQLFKANESLIKQACIYVEYMALDSSAKSPTSQELLDTYQSVLNTLSYAKIKIPAEEGKIAFKTRLFPQLQKLLSPVDVNK